MTYFLFPVSSVHRGATSAWRRAGQVVIVLAGLLVIGAPLPISARAGEPATAPSPVQYVSSADSGQAAVSGTSTFHDWTVKGTLLKGDAKFSAPLSADAVASMTLQSIHLVIPVDSLKSTEGSGMDNTMYEALKRNQFPSVTYTLMKATLKSSPSGQDPAYHFAATGRLTVAGASREVNLDLAALPHGRGQLTISTEVALNMTDFGVSPPTAMMGMIKSGDAVTVKATWQLTLPTSSAGATK